MRTPHSNLTYLITVSRAHIFPAQMCIRTIQKKTKNPIVVVGNLNMEERKIFEELGVKYIDENDIDYKERLPKVTWNEKYRSFGWYKQMFIRLSCDTFITTEYAVILDSEVFVFHNWDEKKFFDPVTGNPRMFYWIPKIRKSEMDYRMYKGAAYLLSFLPECKGILEYADSDNFKRHISGVVFFSVRNVKALWDILENKTDLKHNIHELFNNRPELSFSDHDFYGLAAEYGLFNDTVPTVMYNDLLGWYDNHNDVEFHKFKNQAMWSMCQRYFIYDTPEKYYSYMTNIANLLNKKLPNIPTFWDKNNNNFRKKNIIKKIIKFLFKPLYTRYRYIIEKLDKIEKNNELEKLELLKRNNELAENIFILTNKLNDTEKKIFILTDKLNDTEKKILTLSEKTDSLISQLQPIELQKYLIVNGLLDYDSYLQHANEILQKTAPEQLVDNNYYQLLESLFRGPEETIKEHQKFYIDYLNNNTEFKNTNGKYFLDAGCGRGEFLSLLKENNIECEGVDLNKISVNTLKDKGYKVYCSDILKHLDNLNDNVLTGLSSFQVIEHLTRDYVENLIKIAKKKITKDGVIILETLNPDCYTESTCFYLDPTHITWHFPDNLKLLLEYNDFKNVKIIYSAPIIPVMRNKYNIRSNYIQFAVIGTRS